MDPKLVYAKTPTGDEAVRQRTRVVQRNLRMVLIMVDGKLSVEELSQKIANPQLVESALQELEEGGFIATTGIAATTAWSEALQAEVEPPPSEKKEKVSALSQFSTFESKASLMAPDSIAEPSVASGFSTFGKPILPAAEPVPEAKPEKSFKLPKPAVKLSLPKFKLPEAPALPNVPLFRTLGIALAAVLALAVFVLLFYPYDSFRPAVESSASRLLKTPVTVGQVGLGLLPSPHVKLTDVRVGTKGEARVGEVRIHSPLATVRSGPQTISRLTLSGVEMSVERLLALPITGGQLLDDGELKVAQIRIEQGKLTLSGDLAFSDVYGDMLFNENGQLSKANFENKERSILLEVSPTSERSLRFALEGRAWKPAAQIAVSFDSLQANGVLLPSKLLIQNLDTTFLGGLLKGNWLLDWSNGLAMAGEGTVTRLDSRKVGAAFMPKLQLEGDIGGAFRFRGSGKDWAGLWANIEATMDAEVTRGILRGADLGEASRRGSGAVVRAGQTKFDRLRVSLAMKPKLLVGRNIQLDAGSLTAAGQFACDRQNVVDAALSVSVQSSVTTRRTPVRITGTLPELTTTFSK